LTYRYDSHVSHYFKGPASKLNLSQLAEGLLNRVASERERLNCVDRPIVFVAHSLEGLLVKEALIESKKQINDITRAAVYKSTQAIIFFGTPHRGCDDAKWGLILSTIASAAFNTNNKVIRVLEPDSEVLDKLARDFRIFWMRVSLGFAVFSSQLGKLDFRFSIERYVPAYFRSPLVILTLD
jgi:hypothetical protein